jgi:hypothetical protein
VGSCYPSFFIPTFFVRVSVLKVRNYDCTCEKKNQGVKCMQLDAAIMLVLKCKIEKKSFNS